MRRAAAVLVILLAGCGGEPGGNNAAVTADQIVRVSQPKTVVTDPTATVRLRPLSRDEIAAEGMTSAAAVSTAPGCRFEREGAILLAATGTNAIARVGGQLRHFVQTTPVAGTGGFFEDRRISISVGLTDQGAGAARIAVTNRANQAQVEMAGTWVCGV